MMNRSPRDNEKDSLIIDRKQVSRIVSGALLCVFFIFISGYFWGKKKAIEELSCNFEQEAFCDQLALTDQITPQAQTDNGPEVVIASGPVYAKASSGRSPEEKVPEVALKTDESAPQAPEPKELYQAKLCGFGTEKAAQQLVDRLKNAGITTTIVKRASKPTGRNAAKKKVIYWYQVVTAKYANNGELVTLVQAVKQLEKMHDVQIVKVNDDRNARKNAAKQMV